MKSKILIILFLITTTFIYSQRDVRIISSDFNSVTVEYSPVYIDTSIVSYNGIDFRKAEFDFGRLINYSDSGSPQILTRIINIGVPSEYGNTIEILSSSYQEISGLLIPIPYTEPDSFSVSFDFKKNAEYDLYEPKEDLVSFGEIGLVREVYSQSININPVKFFPIQ
ncbi:MAG: C25 family peptidase propeptide domain-containing protein, partial [Ignavibacteriota bacterium]